MAPSSKSTTRQSEADRLGEALDTGRDAIERAHHIWGLWADSFRQDIEHRHGVGYEPDDPVILNDPEYGRVLDIGGELDRLRGELTALAARFGVIEGRDAQ